MADATATVRDMNSQNRLPSGVIASQDGTLIEINGVRYELQTDAHREVRTLKWRIKLLGKQLGRAGQTIHELRNRCAALSLAITVNPGDYQRLLEQNRDLARQLSDAQSKLRAQAKVTA